MAVAFPSGYFVEHATRLEIDLGVEPGRLYDGTPLSQQRSDVEWHTFDVGIGALDLSDYNTLRNFIRDNKFEPEVTWTIDGIDYSGEIQGPVRLSFQGAKYRIAFRYKAKVV